MSEQLAFGEYFVAVKLFESQPHFSTRDMGKALGYKGGLSLPGKVKRVKSGSLVYVALQNIPYVLNRCTGKHRGPAQELRETIERQYGMVHRSQSLPDSPPVESNFDKKMREIQLQQKLAQVREREAVAQQDLLERTKERYMLEQQLYELQTQKPLRVLAMPIKELNGVDND